MHDSLSHRGCGCSAQMDGAWMIRGSSQLLLTLGRWLPSQHPPNAKEAQPPKAGGAWRPRPPRRRAYPSSHLARRRLCRLQGARCLHPLRHQPLYRPHHSSVLQVWLPISTGFFAGFFVVLGSWLTLGGPGTAGRGFAGCLPARFFSRGVATATRPKSAQVCRRPG